MAQEIDLGQVVGPAGYSPSASVTKAGSVVTITITDQNGTTQQTVNESQLANNLTTTTPGVAALDAAQGPVIARLMPNQNLLHNWDWRVAANTVNQRGAASYTQTAAGYTIDRWKSDPDMMISLADGGLTLKNTHASSQRNFMQYIEFGTKTLLGKTVTFSVSVSDTIYTVVCQVPTVLATGVLAQENFTNFSLVVSKGANDVFVAISVSPGKTVVAQSAKLEMGSVSTLKNDPPQDYGKELAVCRRYFIRLRDYGGAAAAYIGTGTCGNPTNFVAYIQLGVRMRILPAVVLSSLSDVTVYTGGLMIAASGTFQISQMVDSNLLINVPITGAGATTGASGFLRLANNAYLDLDANI